MRVTVNIPEAIGKEAEGAAREEGVSVSALYTRAIEWCLQARRREQAISRINALIGNTQVAPDALDELQRERRASDRSAM